MNAPFPNPTKLDEYQEQLDRSFHWRASYLQQFAELELIVGNCLQLFLAHKKAGVRVTTGQPIRAAIEEVIRLTTAKGAFARQAKFVGSALQSIEQMHLDWRAHVTHGVLGVWRGRKGQWLITLHYRETDNSGPIRWHAMPFEEAQAKSDALACEVRKFEQRFQAVERAFERPAG
jgi:hypothetical protein